MLKKQGQEVTEDGQVIQTKSEGAAGAGSGGRVTTKGGEGGDTPKRKREPAPTQERTSPIQFGREVRSELRKVSWPNRTEVINYSLVVLFTVIVLTLFIGAMDWVFSSFVLELFEPRQ
ncbi:MAG: preprotein translocase subunit SecE [Acidimicrobiaceae bacterium]|nr:preprotein translocase subunit SecE [Acidimicrobiaceae bacterium]